MTRIVHAGIVALLAALFLTWTGPANAAPVDLNVQTDCGAAGNGVADDTTKIQACINLAATTGQAVYIPTGTYKITGQLLIANSNTTIYGTSSSTTTIAQSNGAAHIFDITNGGSPIDKVQIRNLELIYSASNPTGMAILCVTCWRTYFQQMNIGRPGMDLTTGIWVTGGNQVFLQDSVISQAAGQGAYFAGVGDVFMSDVEVNQIDTSTSSVGVVFDTGVGGIYATNVNVTGGHTGFLFENTQGQVPPNFGFFTNCLADTLNGVGWNFQAAQSMRLTNSWAATAALYGMIVKNVNGLSVTDSRIYNNGAEGVLVQSGATNLTIKDSTITGNSRLASNAHAGINVAAGVSNFQILGNQIGAADGFANTQSYGVIVATGATDNYMITNNLMRNNVTGGLQNGATGTHSVVGSNL